MSNKIFLEFEAISKVDDKSIESCTINVNNINHISSYDKDLTKTCIGFNSGGYIIVNYTYEQVKQIIWNNT